MSIGDGVGERIKQARVEKGMNPAQLARCAEVTYTAVWNWETNEIAPRPATLTKVAACLGVSEEFLRTGKAGGDPPPPRDIPPRLGVPPTTEAQSVAHIMDETRVKIARATGFAVDRVKLHLEVLPN